MTTVDDDITTPNQVLSHDNIFAEMNSAVSELEPLLPITPEQRQLLLLKFNWDIETLRNSFQQYADMNSFLIENGVCPENTVSFIKTSECEICCSTGKVLGLRCQHMACLDCWSKYLATKIRDDQCMLLECIELECGMLISNEMLVKLFSCSKLETAHQRLIENSYINSDSSLAWCNRECGMAVRRTNNDTVTCSCGSTFCFLCKLDAHYPATCLQFRLWEKQRMDFGQKTSSWILSNTRDCPRCFAPIQKTGGCAHMKCTGCRHEYCWNCSEDWKTHSGFCTQFGFSVAQFNRNSRQHVARYEHHKNCLKQDPRGLTDFRIQNILVESRRILMNSYVFGYYLKNGVYKSSFETHQQKLEIAVRELVFFKTGPRTSKLAKDCLKLRKTLLAHCVEGAEHENLEGPEPVKSVKTTDADDWVVIRNALIQSFCIVVVHSLSRLLTMTTVDNDRTIPNQVLSHENIFAEMNSAVSKLEPLLPITPIQRQLLLLKFNWDIKSLKNSIEEYADTNSFLLENGVCPKNTVSVINKAECEVCCATEKLLGLRCQHMACLNCWSKYLAAKIKNEECMLNCIEFGCEMLISNEILGRFLRGSKLKIAHRKLIKESYINSDASLAWCNRECGMAVRRTNNDTVTCSCGSTFCFLCRSDAHHPATCRQFRLWEKQSMNSDQKTSSWILSNTKECPRCFIPIQKSGGCNHMTCTGCRYEYCWVCSQNWETYLHYSNCKQADITVARSQSNSKRRSHIFAQHLTRFQHHKQFLKEKTLLSSGYPKTFATCRRTLMYSYVFGYYLKDGIYKSSFEKYQQKLEIAVEKLAVSRSGPSRKMLAEECLVLRKALLAHCAEGAEHENLEGPEHENLEVPEPVKSVTNINEDHWVELCKLIIFSFFIAFVVLVFLSLILFVLTSKK